MRGWIINIFTAVILVFGICGCAETSQDSVAVETENAETEDKGEPDKPVAGEEQEQGEEKADPLSNAAEQDMFTYIISDNGAVITGLQEGYEGLGQESMSTDREIKIPDTLGGYSVVEIGDHAFENIKLKSVNIPESVEIIGESAFRNTDIENVNFSQCHNLKEVKDHAFENCNLQEEQDCSTWFMEKIGERAFAGNGQLTRVNFWSGDVVIGSEAFNGCGDEMLFYVEWSREEAGKEVEAYAAANGIKVEYAVSAQIHLPSEPLLLTPQIGSFLWRTGRHIRRLGSRYVVQF